MTGYYQACNKDLFYHYAPGADQCAGTTGREMDFSRNNETHIGGATGLNGTYSSRAFSSAAVRIIEEHDPAKGPLYLYVAPQNVHLGCGKERNQGIQAPCESVDLYPRVANDTFKVQSAVTTELDYVVGNVTEAMKEKGLWSNTVVTFASDNGGPLDHTTNWPLRGGKHTFWDGGVRVVAFVSGGLLPESRRGTVWTGMAHSSDWYSTLFEGVAGGTLPDGPNATGPMPPDSFNLWEAIHEGTASPRTEVIHEVANSFYNEGCEAIQRGDMKLIVGNPGDNRILAWPEPAAHAVPFGETSGVKEAGTDHCRSAPSKAPRGPNKECPQSNPCLFNVTADENETHNLAKDPQYKKLVKELKQRLAEVGAKAPPRDQYWPEEQLKQQKTQICAAMTKTGFLEPVSHSRGE